MSIQAVAWVLTQSGEDLPGTARLIMIALANHADHVTGHCWPSIETIAKEAGCGERTVFRYLPALARNGFIETRSRRAENGRVRSNDYWMLFDRPSRKWEYFGDKEEQTAKMADGEADGDSAPMADGPTATGGSHNKMLEPSGLEPSESEQVDSGRASPPDVAPAASSPAAKPVPPPNRFDPNARRREYERIKAAEKARTLPRIPVIRGTEPWQAWVRHGHPDTLFTRNLEMPNGRREWGWYFPTLWPPKAGETGPPLPLDDEPPFDPETG